MGGMTPTGSKSPDELRQLTTRVPRGVYTRLRLAAVLQDESIQEVVTAALDAYLPSAQVLQEAREAHRGGGSGSVVVIADQGSEPEASATDQTDPTR